MAARMSCAAKPCKEQMQIGGSGIVRERTSCTTLNLERLVTQAAEVGGKQKGHNAQQQSKFWAHGKFYHSISQTRPNDPLWISCPVSFGPFVYKIHQGQGQGARWGQERGGGHGVRAKRP